MEQRGGHEAGRHAQGGRHTPTLVGPLWLHRPTSSTYIYSYTRKHPGAPRNPISTAATFCTHEIPLGAFSGAPPEGESITEGFYINTIASPMKCEQFTIDLRVHSYQLDGFLSLFGSQYKVLHDSLGDLFDVILFAVCLSRSDELWVYDQVYL